MMRRTILLLALAVAATGDDVVTLWVGKLTGDDATKHATAHKVLVRKGTPALPGLREALRRAEGEATQARLTAVIREVEKREPHGLLFDAGMPKMKITLDMVNRDRLEFVIRVRNKSDKPVVLYPYLGLRVLDPAGAPVKHAHRRGRFGLRPRPEEWLRKVRFVWLPPGKIWTIKTGIARYMHDPADIFGWQLAEAGTYTLEFTYHFERASAKRGCDPKWEPLDDPKQPWNRALEMKHTFTAEMRVQ